jgi:DNA invertase Pin-like site-specific DNA recombinase
LRQSPSGRTLAASYLAARCGDADRLREGIQGGRQSAPRSPARRPRRRRRRAVPIYEDGASGRKDSRPGLAECLEALRPGNTLAVWKLDRLGRDLRHLVDLVDALRRNETGLRVLAGAGAEIDTTTANGRLVFGIFASLAEFERELIAERTRAGLAAARARGRNGGRPRKMDRKMLRMAMSAMADRETQAKDPARRLGITTTTLYMYVNGDVSPKAPGQALLDGATR